MQTNILWTGREYQSMENCLVSSTATGMEINSTIVGYYDSKIYWVEYRIKTNMNWETVFLAAKSRHSNHTQHVVIDGDGKGNWVANGKPVTPFSGCMDVDITLTPFTNTLPIKRLNLLPGEQQQISVIYFDILANEVKRVTQLYKRISATELHFENVPNDFEANIQVDEDGFVTDYPGLFARTAALTSRYY